MKFKEWDGFVNGDWQSEIDVRDFIQKNYTPYTGDDSFLSEATNTTKKLWDEVLALYKKESAKNHAAKWLYFCETRKRRSRYLVQSNHQPKYNR